MKTQIFGGIILLIVAGLFARYKIFDDKIELKYSLSEKIPSDFIDNVDESGIQQLTIKNSGDILITSIVVKINATIQDVKTNKFKSTDSVSLSKTKSHFEILYPELPPLGEIIVLLKSTGTGINKNNIEIYHSKGIAKEAFSDNDSYGNIIFLIVSVIYLILVLFSLKNSFRDSLESRAKYSSMEILRRKKPWFVNEIKWLEIRKNAISNFIEGDYVLTIEKSEIFQLLNSEKKQFLSEDEWHILLNKAENKIQLKITEKIYKSYYGSGFEELFNLKKPLNISFESWKKINEEVSKAFCIHKIRDVLRYGSHDSAIALLNDKKPEIVTNDDWLNLKKIITAFYISSIIEEGLHRISYEKYIDKVNLDILEASRKKELQDLFGNMGEAYELKEYFRQMLLLLNEMFIWDKIPNKPESVETEDWKRIEKLYNRIIKTEKEATENLLEAKKLKDEYMPLKEKVTKQLQIIDNLLNEPKSIDKIEVFDNPFAKGNWENIQKISEILKNK